MTSKILFISIFILLSINSVFAISVNTATTFQSNCPGANVNETIYITGATQKIYPTDLMISDNKLLFVRNEESTVSIWQNTANTLTTGCFKELDSTNTGWGRLSNVVPGTNQYVGIFKNFGNLCDVNKVRRIDTTRPSVQFVYRVAYKEELSLSTGTSNYFYYPYSSGVLSSSPTYLSNQTKRNWGEIKYHANECHNFTFEFCGDGLLDTSHGEVCDDGNNIDGDGCSATCQMETVSTCNSLTANPNSGNPPLTSAFTCSATNATSYRIDVYSGSTIINTINNSTGSYTFSNSGSYTARCTINGSITSNACLTSITVGGTTPTPNIDINKLDANSADLDGNIGNDTQTVNVSSGAVFRIRVTNNYTEILTNLVLTDTVAPNCAGSVTLPSTFPSTWTGVTVGGSGSHTNATLEVGEYIDYVCDRSNTTVGYTNSATVNGVGLISNQSVTDTDTTVVLTPTISGPTCGTAGGYVFPYTTTTWPSNLTFCSTGAIPNPNTPVFPAQNGSTSWTCSSNGSTVTCNASRGGSGGGGGGGGGGGPSCTRISIPTLEATGAGKAMALTGSVNLVCYGNSHVGTIGIDCDSDGNGGTKSITEQKTAVTNGVYKTANFTCTYNTLNTVPHPKCYVTSGGGTVTTSSPSSLACSTGLSVGSNSCGDGVVQRPNSNGQMEVCEAVNGIFPSWCINCQTTNFTIPGEGRGILTFPGNGNIFFKPLGTVIIGASSNPFTIFGTQPYVSNDSSEDLFLNYPLCVYNTNSSVLLKSDGTGFDSVCSSQPIGWLYPGVTKTFQSLNNGQPITIKGLKITDATNYKDTILKTTLQGFPDAFFSAHLKVRVSKPAVATVGGGTSLVKNNKVTADINKVASDGYSNPDKNKNYVGAGISTGNSSSYTKNINNTTSVTKVSSGQTSKTTSNLTKVSTSQATGNKTIGETHTKYNGLSNVFIVKNGDLTINTSITGIGARTYIVEGGDLIINTNITYADNIAFVVKGGDIIIDSSVTKINGTFISIKVSGVGGKIISEETDNKLLVNGSLYADIESLVNNRTHIENKNDLINVGTIVSFGSSLFRKQAPLVGDFIGEYIASKKVAK